MSTVGESSEDALLARIGPVLPRGDRTLLGSGDDAAVVAAPDGRVVVTTDVLVEGVHFRRDWCSGYDVGRRAAVQNLADVAAMGARPSALVVAVVLPADLPVRFVDGLAAGLAAQCAPLGVGVVGGDLSGGPVVVVSVTAFGDLGGSAPVLRSGAHVGDVVALAGTVGRSAAGLALLTAGRADLDPGLVDSYRCPTSPLAAGPDAARAGATAMLDVSDGLVRDGGRIAAASGVRLALDDPGEVLAADLARVAGVADALGLDPAALVLGGGEDHGLLATFPADLPLPAPFRPLGRVEPGTGLTVAGRSPVVIGFDHFGAQPRR